MYPIYTFGRTRKKINGSRSCNKREAHWLVRPPLNPSSAQSRRHATRAVKKETSTFFNGEKMWITSGSIANGRRCLGENAKTNKVRGFLVEKGTPGFKTWDVHGKWSLRASVTSGLSFSDCEIPEENLLPGVTVSAGPLQLPESGALRHRLGRHRRSHGLLRHACNTQKTRKQFANKPTRRTNSFRKNSPG